MACKRERIKCDFKSCGLSLWKKRVGFPEMEKGGGRDRERTGGQRQPGEDLTSHGTYDYRHSCYAVGFDKIDKFKKKV